MSDIFSANDIICFAETWLENSDNLLFWGDENEFEEINTEALRRHRKGRASSGMSLFLRKSILPGSEILSKDSDHIWIKLKKEFFNFDHDIYVCFVYVHPLGSPWLMGNKCLNFQLLKKESATYKQKGKIMIIGDMNGRTGEEIDYITNDSLNPYLPVPENYMPNTQSTKHK